MQFQVNQGMEPLDYTLTKFDGRSMDGWQGAMDLNNPYGSRALLRSGEKSHCAWSHVCKIAVTLLILLLIAWGIAVPLYFMLGPGPYNHGLAMGVAEGHTSEQGVLNGTVLNAANGTMVISNQRYTTELSNEYSAEHQSIKLKLETLLGVVFNKNTDFNKAAITRLRPRSGTVEIQFVLIFHKNQPQVRDLVEAQILNYLAKHWSMLGTYQIDISTLVVDNLRNQCAVDNGGCSHLCFWSILSDGYECRCPQSYQLLGDTRTCFPAVVPKVTSTRNPCTEGHFACRSGSCIPHHWLCDGVSDCLLGEDEARHMCRPDNEDGIPSLITNNPADSSSQGSTTPVLMTLPTRKLRQEKQLHAQFDDILDTPRIVWQRSTPDKSASHETPIVPNLQEMDTKQTTIIQPGRPNKFKYFG